MKIKKDNYVYSVKITKEQMSFLKNNKDIKNDLNTYVREYINSFLEIKSKEDIRKHL